jgi:hypothetical protein
MISEATIFSQSAIVQMVKTKTYLHCLLHSSNVSKKIIKLVCCCFIYGMQREVEKKWFKNI